MSLSKSIEDKPVYFYSDTLGGIFIGQPAILQAHNHPKFGNKVIRTSMVVAFDSEGVIETKNSIYKKAPNE